jgi:hypothetical protein
MTVLQVEERKADVFGEEKHSSRQLASRYCYRSLRTILEKEMGINDESWRSSAIGREAVVRMQSDEQAEEGEERVVLPATKEEEAMYPPKPRALSTVSTHPFARPDLQQFDVFKSAVDASSAEPKTRAPRTIPDPSPTELAARQARAQRLAPPMPGMPGLPPPHDPMHMGPPMPMHPGMPPHGGMMPMMPPPGPPVGMPPPMAIPPPIPPPTQPVAPPPQPTVPLPIAITAFLSSLPPRLTFNGPTIPVDAVMNILRGAILVPPSQNKNTSVSNGASAGNGGEGFVFGAYTRERESGSDRGGGEYHHDRRRNSDRSTTSSTRSKKPRRN